MARPTTDSETVTRERRRRVRGPVSGPVATVMAIGLMGSGAPPAAADPDDRPGTYTNHVMDDIADAYSDPSIIRGKDGYWYAYASQTSMTRENAGGPWNSQRFMPITRSSDLVNWTYVGDVFSPANHPEWRDFGSTYYWAPDIRYINGKYYLYYSVAGNDDNTIALATADHPAGPWKDIGRPVLPYGKQVNQIDPSVFVDTDGEKYLYYGSFRDGGIQAVRLDAEGTAPAGEPVQVVGARRGEAAYVTKRDGWYYLFYSGLGCCARDKGAYPVFVGRSKSPTGPFVDAENVGLADLHPGGTIVNSPNGNKWVATGHSADVVDKSGQEWILTNGFDRFETDPDWGGRPTVMDRLDWIDGWPTVRAGAWTSEGVQTAPVARWDEGSDFEAGLGGFRTLGTGAWKEGTDPDSGRYAQAPRAQQAARATGARSAPQLLIPSRAPKGDVRLEADVRLRDDRGGVGLVLAAGGARDHLIAWVDSDRALTVELTRGGKVRKTWTERLHPGVDVRTWHSLNAEIRDGRARVEISSAMLGMPLAEIEVDVPDTWRRGGTASRHGSGEVDNVGVTRLYTPVTRKKPDPKVGKELTSYREDFTDDTLDGWEWFGPSDGQVADGKYVWPTQDADFSGTGTMASALLRDAPKGTYTAEAKLRFPITDAPDGRSQAGLIAFRSPADSVHLAPTRTGPSRQVFLWIGRDRDSWPEMQIGPSADTMWLRMRHTVDPRTGEHMYQAATSRDGKKYIWGGVWSLPAGDDPRIGLVSLAGEGVTAEFDHVRFYD
ncbi:family 43 glycosylhydrolase [Streptomyces sp. CWNU-52B]|uniref:family 43 glycosylhydrolase n=1 Tax=unclassified Streptomyces TaxID=2593676 RepID=UPI0039C446C9